MINVLRVLHDTTVDGPGFRTSIYCAGCRHQCPGCHNPQSWAFGAGEDRSTDDLLDEITSDPFADVTFTGGDPFFQVEGFTELAFRGPGAGCDGKEPVAVCGCPCGRTLRAEQAAGGLALPWQQQPAAHRRDMLFGRGQRRALAEGRLTCLRHHGIAF